MTVSLAHVKRYQQLGFLVLPACPPDHDCKSPGKIPYDAVGGHHMSGWQDAVQFTLDQWDYFLRTEPNINIGALTGEPSGLLFIDLDTEDASVEFDRLAREADSQRSRPRGYWEYRTGKGRHLIFRSTDGHFPSRNITTANGSVIEVQGDGRFSVLPPSIHHNGRQYAWSPGRTPRSLGIDRAYDWLTGGTAACSVTIDTADTTDWEQVLTEGEREGNRNHFLTRVAGLLINEGPKPEAVVRLLLRAYNQVHINPPISNRELDSIIHSISKAEASIENQIRERMAEYGDTREQAREALENVNVETV